ncbi:hypothetical protein QBC39DRAFT_408934 [Podospora conica]|nr:hypothetical protein QBC39DRAFT_408934 [Schizothecium conicum]
MASPSGPSLPEAYLPGPPFPPRSAQLGGTPTPIPDIPISAVFILLFLLSALFHLLTIFLDRRRPHPPSPPKPPPPLPPNDTIATTLSRSSYHPSDDDGPPPPHHHPGHRSRPLPTALLTVFSLLRITALSLRIASAAHPSHHPLAIAAAEFTSAGVALLLVVNLLLARRLVRDYCPSAGVWRKAPIRVFRFLVFGVVACLVMVVSASAESFFLDDEDALRRAGNVQKVSAVVLVFLAAAPVGFVGVVGRWGRGLGERGRARRALVVGVAVLLVLEVGFRCGVAFEEREVDRPGWMHSRAAYYCFVFAVEVVVLGMFLMAMVDPKFREGPRDGGLEGRTDGLEEKRGGGWVDGLMRRINSRRDVFG